MRRCISLFPSNSSRLVKRAIPAVRTELRKVLREFAYFTRISQEDLDKERKVVLEEVAPDRIGNWFGSADRTRCTGRNRRLRNKRSRQAGKPCGARRTRANQTEALCRQQLSASFFSCHGVDGREIASGSCFWDAKRGWTP